MAEKFEGLLTIPATDGNFTSGIGRLKDAQLKAMLERLTELNETEGGHKARIAAVKKEIKTRTVNSTEIVAVEKMAEDIATAEELYADGMPYELERIENEIRFYQDQAGTALLEMGKRFIRVKAHEGHGGFLKSLEGLGMAERSAQYAMLAARKFSNTQATAYLGNEKLRALSVLEEDEIKTLDTGGSVKGMTLDDIDRMTTRELRENLRKEKEKVRKEKEARKHDREVQEAAIAQKEMKINELDQQLRYQQPPTKEQTALAALFELNKDYTFALAEVTASIRKAHAIVVRAEKIPGTDALMLNGWFNQYSAEMETFAALHEAWTDEVDNASPIETGEIIDGEAEGENV